MRESRPRGSVRGALGNGRPYRDNLLGLGISPTPVNFRLRRGASGSSDGSGMVLFFSVS